MFYYERKFRRQGCDLIIGVDEAGRGPLAGPVVAAAVALQEIHFKNRIDDSKKLTFLQRENAYLEIIHKSVFGLGIVNEKIIDRLNILVSTAIAMEQAVQALIDRIYPDINRREGGTFARDEARSEDAGVAEKVLRQGRTTQPQSEQMTSLPTSNIRIGSKLKDCRKRVVRVLVDGNVELNLDFPVTNIIKGDAKSKSIAAASILAKVTRDRIMAIYDQVYPQYGFLKHKGYPTIMHRRQVEKFGPCLIHRRSFTGV